MTQQTAINRIGELISIWYQAKLPLSKALLLIMAKEKADFYLGIPPDQEFFPEGADLLLQKTAPDSPQWNIYLLVDGALGSHLTTCGQGSEPSFGFYRTKPEINGKGMLFSVLEYLLRSRDTPSEVLEALKGSEEYFRRALSD